MKVISILPLTENFSKSLAGAVSLFIDEIDNNNINLKVVGSTECKDIINARQYINVTELSKFPRGKNYSYISKVIEILDNQNFDLIEVHNRPQICKEILKKKDDIKIVLYFHNDPNKLRGSISIKDKLFLLKNCSKIVFISEWIKNQFFSNLTYKNSDKTEVIYHAPIVKNRRKIKKEKIILFAGKLNSSKGYDIFCKVAEIFLKNNKKWKFIVAGDEPREKIEFSHKNFVKKGWLSHKKVSELFKKTSIVIVPSMWDEPLGRVAIEASKSGCAVITSRKGGLLECAPFSFMSNSNNGILEILNQLTNDHKLLSQIMRNVRNYNFIRSNIFVVRKKIKDLRALATLKNFNINKNRPIKILHVADLHLRHNGRLYYSTIKKLNNGFVKNNYNIQFFSDRDTLSYKKSLKDPRGVSALNKSLKEYFSHFKPDILLLGHADSISNETLLFLKKIYRGFKTSQWFLDPIIKEGPDFIKNTNRFRSKLNMCDTNFITTYPDVLGFNNNKIYYLPNPVDSSIDCNKIYENEDNIYDLFIAISHGQHRGVLKKLFADPRLELIQKIINSNYIKTNLFGDKKDPVWGDQFFYELNKCSMALNLSRGKPTKYYSSDRIASLMGNGALTFTDEKSSFGDFFSKKEIVTFKNQDDLIDKLEYFKENSKERKFIAKNGKKKYFKLFNNLNICKYIVDVTLGKKISKPW